MGLAVFKKYSLCVVISGHKLARRLGAGVTGTQPNVPYYTSSLLVCERYLLSITLLPVLLLSFTENRAQILYFQCGLKPAEFQDLSELLAPVYTVEESSPIVLFKVTIFRPLLSLAESP